MRGKLVAKSNLVPEVRADRNGRLVTRHVKAEAAGKGRSALPAPAQTGPDLKTQKAQRALLVEKTRVMLIELMRVGVDVMGETQAQHNVHHLIKTDSGLAQEIITYLATATDAERDIWKHELSFDHRTPADWRDETDYMQTYRHSMGLNPTAVLLAEPQPYNTHPMHFARSLVHDATDAARSHGRIGDMAWMKAVMLVSETYAKAHDMHRRKVDLSSLKDDVDFVQDNWEAVQPLIPELIRRNNASRDFITTLMTSAAVSLSEGML